ncbi:MAG: DHH family phosphoesterase [Candidatus Omnitrophica bacterium]|nr:DHH family phosphoesterase [Candidatus Omnitrophota bacterium]
MKRPSGDSILKHLNERGRELSPLLILTHNHPDPDTIASAWALSFLAERRGVRTRIVYSGVIGRMENQKMIDLLRVPIHPLRRSDLDKYHHVALVDTQPPFRNNVFPMTRQADIVIDHHPRHKKTRAKWVLVDPRAGATTTLLAEAVLKSGLELPARLATALVYGIGSETQNLGREADVRDRAIFQALFAKASMKILAKIQNPPRPSSFFNVLGRAIQQAFVIQRIIGVHLGNVPSQDIVAHMADFLLTHEKVRWSIVTGRHDGFLHVSLRTNNTRAEAGKLLWKILGAGSAGGHGMIAGGHLEIGRDAAENEWQQAEEKITHAFLRSQHIKPPFELEYPFRLLNT